MVHNDASLPLDIQPTSTDLEYPPNSNPSDTRSPAQASTPLPSAVKESEVWSGSPSHIINLKYHLITLGSLILIPPLWGAAFQLLQWSENTTLYLICISPWILTPLLYSLWKIIEIRCHHYILTTERLRHITGVFNKHTEEIELYRVRDTELSEPFLLRLVNAGNVIILSSDSSSPRFTIKAIKQAHHFRELLRAQVENCRQQKGVREWQIG